MTDLGDLLGRVGVDDFFSSYFERRPLHVRRAINQPWLTETDVDGLIRATAQVDSRRLRANVRGQVLVPPSNCGASDTYDWAISSYASGATLVLNYVEALDLRYASLASALGVSLHAKVTFTVFMTPAGAQGFAPHFDTLDVFVMQMAGQKEWHLGDFAVELPTLRQGYLVAGNPESRSTVQMKSGDMLYIPRGTIHWAHTQEQPSLHVTADIDTATMGDLLDAAVAHSALLNDESAFSVRAAERLAQNKGGVMDHDLAGLLRSVRDLPELCRLARADKWSRRR
ncbi:cupin domain-containing protein [Pseudomonas aeruginosa]|uniref:cupin domain-containing protein n=1 Tax=Pseudomonas aeruginosa TaxID=287 RepID=UPI000EB03155|nr:cupin domain-containing protein [Pseudomonas aeruginosa]TXL29137.1 hypothetical protein FIT60_05395 [Pseudomonas aeruginosa]